MYEIRVWVALALASMGLLLFQARALAQGAPPSCNPASPVPTLCGEWQAIADADWVSDDPGSPTATLVQAIHMVLTHTGYVIVWDIGTDGEGGYVHYWNPKAPHDKYRFAQTPTYQDLFCAGHVVLADGRVLVIGGTDRDPSVQADDPVGLVKSFLLNPSGNPSSDCSPLCSWVAGPDMGQRRWYPTGTTLPDGRVLALSGWEFGRDGDPNRTPGPDLAEIPDVYNVGTSSVGSWTPLSNAPKTDISLYPAIHLDPSSNGTRVLYVGPGDKPNVLYDGVFVKQNIFRLDVGSQSWTDQGSQNTRGHATIMYYDTGATSVKILKSGGVPEGAPTGNNVATNQAEIISVSLSDGQPTPASTGFMVQARAQHQLTILPDATVLATGGTTSSFGAPDACENGVFVTELWDPSDGQWHQLKSMVGHRPGAADGNPPAVPRMYHSTGLLLPDGSVLSGGGECEEMTPDTGKCPGYDGGGCLSADFFKPPYLWKKVGQNYVEIGPQERPSITSPPAFVAYGEGMSFPVSFGAGSAHIDKVALIRPGAVTHSRNMDQRSIRLVRANGDFTDGGTLTVLPNKMPNSRLAPPGYYMLFLVNSMGRPSVAPFVNLWGIVESSVSVETTQGCQPYLLTFEVEWDATVQAEATDSDDIVEVYAPGPACSGSANTGSATVTAGSFHHRVVVPVSNMCATGTWTLRIHSRKGSGSTASVSTFCTSTSVTCISCQPPPCSPTPCEID